MKTIPAKTEPERMAYLRKALTPDRVCFLPETTKDEALCHLIDVLAGSDAIGSREELAAAVFKRESLMSTGIGLGLAVPHVRLGSVRSVTMAVGISRTGLADYASLDDKPVHLVFLIAAPDGQHVEYLRLLAVISARAKTLGPSLRDAPDEASFYAALMNGNGNEAG
jgi:PTS system nitrogen regulatory IIA component